MILKPNEKPQLSILIPSIPSRFDLAKQRYMKYMGMVRDKNIEILLYMDNKKRSIGYKREGLKNLSQGKYFMICDDDDELLSIDEIYEATFQDVDVITFKQNCLNTDGGTFTVTFGIGNEIEHNTEDGRYLDCKRPPFHICAWNEKFKHIPYPDISYGEDGVWSLEANRLATTEIHINKILHSYNFSSETTEASTEDNEFWKNPNK